MELKKEKWDLIRKGISLRKILEAYRQELT
jgi:hypothetical protein